MTSRPAHPPRAPAAAVVGKPDVRFLDVTVDEADLDGWARRLGADLGLASAADVAAARVTRCKQGITNKLLKVSLPNGTKYLVRVYGHGTSALIDRDAEVRNMAWLAAHGMAPPLHARFRNGLVYGFVPGDAAHPEALAHPAVWPAIARHVAEWHALPLPPAAKDAGSTLFPTLDRWLAMVYESAGPSATHFHGIALADLTAQRDLLAATLPATPVVFAHNDLLSGNIILQHADDITPPTSPTVTTSSGNDSDDHIETESELRTVARARFIDYEYGGVGCAAFDIANSFCEWAGFDCEYYRYPSLATQRAWLRVYLGASATDAAVDVWQAAVAEYTLAAHLYWILWALVQATVSDIDFDYAAYANLRWAEYHRWAKTKCPPPPPCRPASAASAASSALAEGAE
ncbi:hypothetical protein H9P43_003726 [Blastocladiella emersonii ATCC 22665]|nr:hypothetical protein H9P43_003726 [Blastocladiella emersonii ATCC 22665]